jgi:hypothetical protein
LAKIKVVEPRINPDLDNNLFKNVPSSTIFQISDFSVTTSFAPRVVKDFSKATSPYTAPYTLDSLNVTHDVAIAINDKQQKIVFNRDNSELSNYAYFGSSEDYLKSTIQNVLTTFPASLYVYTYNNNIQYNTVLNYSYDPLIDVAIFDIPAAAIVNKFGLTYISGATFVNDTVNKNVNLSYLNYSIWRSDSGDTEYNILGYTGSSTTTSGNITVKVKGNVFPEALTAVTVFKSYHIRPNFVTYNHYIATLNVLSKYMLSTKIIGAYVFNLKSIVRMDDGGEVLVDVNYKWETSDGYNPDSDSTSYQNLLLDLMDLGISYDNYKSNLILRQLIPESVLLYDLTSDQKISKLLKTYGHELDQIKGFIDQLAFFHNLSYDKIDNLPDLLVKNLARTLGWETFNIVEEDDLFAHVFGNITASQSEISASYVDIELWRRILLNTAWLYKSKGTRKAIEVIFEFIGAPAGLVEISEHVYLASGKINPDLVTIDFPTGTKPFDADGYPITIREEDFFFFQISGNTDRGQAYIDIYRQAGFKIDRIVDNKKSWVKDVENVRNSNTYVTSYTVTDEKLVINTKEITLSFDIARAIEYDMYSYNQQNDYPVTSSGRTLPYPQLETNKFQTSGLSFSQYIEKVYSAFVDVKNRKVIDDNHGGGYPALYKLYEDYLTVNNPSSKAYTFDKLQTYLHKIDSFWKHFVDQLIPATTILTETGLKIRNTIFRPQKFVYKHGIDDGSEFVQKQPVSTDGIINTITIKPSIIETTKGTIKSYGTNGLYDFSHDGNINNNLITSVKQNINLQPLYSSTTFSFTNPTWVMSGATKVSGCTGTTIGPELIVNGNFSQSSGGWVDLNLGPHSLITGITGNIDLQSYVTSGIIQENLLLVPGKKYKLKFTVVSALHPNTISIGSLSTDYMSQDSLAVYSTPIANNTDFVLDFTATYPILFFIPITNTSFIIDTVSLKEVITIPIVCNGGIYCYNNNSKKDLWFNFTGNTSSLTANTGTLFNYKVFQYDKVNSVFGTVPVYTRNIPYSQFSGGSLSFTDSIPNIYLNGDQEYLIKGYFTGIYKNFSAATWTDTLPYNTTEQFDNNVYPDMYNPSGNTDVERFFDRSLYSGYTGYSFTSEIDYTKTYPGNIYGFYDLKLDYYFISMLCSQTPILTVNGNPGITVQTQYINDSYVVQGNNITDFFLTKKPVGDVDVAVNGMSLQKGAEYGIVLPTFPSGTYKVVLVNPLSASTNDVITISYITDGTDVSVVGEFYNVTGITSGSTPSVGVKIFYNTGTTLYEYYLDSGIVTVNNVQLNLNGLTLANGIDFVLSISNDKKLVLNGQIKVGDEIETYYITSAITETVYTIPDLLPQFIWSIPVAPTNVDGLFTVEISSYGDTGFTTTLYSATTGYIIGQNIYNEIVDMTGSSANTKYRTRVIDDKYYTTLNGLVVTSTTISNNVIIKTSV